MNSENNLSAADIAAVTGNRGGMGGFGYGDGSFIWIIILFLFAMFNGGWGNNGNGGMNGGMGMYPWLNQQSQINDGFQNQMLNSNLNSIQNGITAGFGDLQTALCGGFAGVNATINNAQMNDMQNAFAMQNAMNQGFNGLQSQLQQCCCDNRAATADLKYTVAQENCLDRNQALLNTRDIIEAIRTGNQQIMDNQNAYRLEQKNDRIAELERQLAESRLTASQIAQDQRIVDSVYNRFKDCPVGTMPVYGNQPIFTCNGNQGCGCSGNSFYN